ncbi:hypothetical protein KUTeg_002640 [Tegillarca granosa]|uniref:Caspase-8 n=1 Tax=Tegillarca granosa TaxID=220873 RepID=A0ABQ9FUY1_TEGGR|nr:hypothetical protein KUTeg_002640 [Tegillarca granosa]
MTSNSPGNDLNEDADPHLPSDGGFKLLVKVDEELGSEDLVSLKFLTRGTVSDSKLEKVNRGIKLFEQLRNCGKLVPEEENFEFLIECLYRIHRLDLVRRLKGNPKQVARKLSQGILQSNLSPFRVMLFEVGEDISTDEFRSLTFLLSSEIPRAQLQKMKSVFDLFIYLEKNEILCPEDVSILIRVLKEIDRGDLKKKVEDYQNSHEGGLPRNHILPQNRTKNPQPVNNTTSDTQRFPVAGRSVGIQRVPSAGTVSNVSMEEHQNYQRQVSLPLSDNVLFHICPEVIKYPNWQCLPDILGFTKDQMDRILAVTDDPGLQIFHMLKYWRDNIMNKDPSCSEILKNHLENLGFSSAANTLNINSQPIQRNFSDLSFEPMETEPMPNNRDIRDSSIQQPTRQVGNFSIQQPAVNERFSSNQQMARVNPYSDTSVAPVIKDVDLQKKQLHCELKAELMEHINGMLDNLTPLLIRLQVYLKPAQLHRFKEDTSSLFDFMEQRGLISIGNYDVLKELFKDINEPAGHSILHYESKIKELSEKEGVCIIINNDHFFKIPGDDESKEMPGRTGTHIDAEKLQYIFQKLDFIVERKDNLQDFEMVRFLVEVSLNTDHSQFDSFVCCILSHGALGNVYGTNGRLVRIQTLTSCFQSQRCPSLAGKPKLFFIQACQGREKQRGIEIETDAARDCYDTETDAGNREMIPDEADFVLGYATVPGYVSYRSRSQGSWYINKLVEMLDKYASRYDLLSILVKVNEEVGRANANIEGGRFKQIPAPLVTLRKKLFFR